MYIINILDSNQFITIGAIDLYFNDQFVKLLENSN